MTKQEFLEKFSQTVLQVEDVITEDTNLLELSEWDSLAQIATIAFFDKEMGVKISFQELEVVKSSKNLLEKCKFSA